MTHPPIFLPWRLAIRHATIGSLCRQVEPAELLDRRPSSKEGHEHASEPGDIRPARRNILHGDLGKSSIITRSRTYQPRLEGVLHEVGALNSINQPNSASAQSHSRLFSPQRETSWLPIVTVDSVDTSEVDATHSALTPSRKSPPITTEQSSGTVRLGISRRSRDDQHGTGTHSSGCHDRSRHGQRAAVRPTGR